MKRMLINGNLDEIRVALIESVGKGSPKLYDLDIEDAGRKQKKGSVYKGIISHLEPSLDAAFVDYGAGRNGFLPFKEIALTREQHQVIERGEKLGVGDVVRRGQEVLVQVEKEERGNKGAALTTFISLAGCYLVLMPNDPDAGGISRRIDGEDRQEMKDALSQLNLPEGMGVIIRTAGVGRNVEELQWDLDVQMHMWTAIQDAYQKHSAPFLIYQDSDVVMRSIRDYLRRDISEILIDHSDVYERTKKHIQMVRPDFLESVKLYADTTPLFTRFQIESQIESAYQREVRLPSGGAIVIDHTEALVSIDVNSAKSVRGTDIEETALHTNLEAADEIARQLRLRDLGGLVVIDFIDMGPVGNRQAVENRLRDATKMDRARIQIGRLSPRFGLLEMSRQRLRPSLGESSLLTCPRCHGSGVVRGIESLALSILRLIEEAATKEKIKHLCVQAPVEIATYLLNEKREAIARVEERHRVNIMIVPNIHYTAPNFKIDTVQDDGDSRKAASYQLVQAPDIDVPYVSVEKNIAETALIQAAETIQQLPEAPKKEVAQKIGVFTKLWRALFAHEVVPEKPVKVVAESTQRSNNNRTANRGGNHQAGTRNRRGQQGLSVKDVAKQQAQSERASGNRNVKNPRPERSERPERTPQDPAARRERKPRVSSNTAAQEEVVIVKIQSPIANKPEPQVEVPVSVPSSQAMRIQVADYKPVVVEPVASDPLFTPSTPLIEPVEPVRAEDIFAKAQKMLAAQSVMGEVTQSKLQDKIETPIQVHIAQPAQQVQENSLPVRTVEVGSASPAEETVVADVPTGIDESDAKNKTQDKFRPRRSNHQRLRGKGRRGVYHKKNDRADEQKQPTSVAAPAPSHNSNDDGQSS